MWQFLGAMEYLIGGLYHKLLQWHEGNENVPSYVFYFHPPQDTCTHVSSPFSVTEEELPETVSYQVPAQ